MKIFILAISLSFTSFSFAETLQLPDATVNQDVLGGDILLIKMKDYLIITGIESQALERELGIELKKNFTRDIVITKSFEELVALYDPFLDRTTVQTVLNRYSIVLTKINSESRLK